MVTLWLATVLAGKSSTNQQLEWDQVPLNQFPFIMSHDSATGTVISRFPLIYIRMCTCTYYQVTSCYRVSG